MGYGTGPTGKPSIISIVPSAGRDLATGRLTVKGTTVSAPVTSPVAAGIMTSNADWFRNNFLTQPTRQPGGNAPSTSPQNAQKGSAPGVVASTMAKMAVLPAATVAIGMINPKSDPSYVPANAPDSTRLYATATGGSTTMGLLDSAKTFATSTGGKALIGGAVSALTSAKGAGTVSTSRAVNPRTGRPYRHINPANGKAVSRAVRRLSSFSRMAHRVEKQIGKYARRHSK